MNKFLKFRSENNDKDIYMPTDFIMRFESSQDGTKIFTNNGGDVGEESYELDVDPEELIKRIYEENPDNFEIIPIGYPETRKFGNSSSGITPVDGDEFLSA